MKDCIEWEGYCTTDGYGETRVDGEKFRVHRLEWIRHHGAIPNGLVVRHKCDNRKCYNIAHLELGTTQDNTADRVKRGRSAKGETNGNSKLTEIDVKTIRSSHLNQRKLAAMYNVSQGVISQIKTYKTWRHI